MSMKLGGPVRARQRSQGAGLGEALAGVQNLHVDLRDGARAGA
ncbi:hypothetical protein [Inhella gelatinilytica]|nr:hypothetical protein [Inhella gelatinilytica]